MISQRARQRRNLHHEAHSLLGRLFAAVSVIDVHAAFRESVRQHREFARRIHEIHDEHFGFDGMKALLRQQRFAGRRVVRDHADDALLDVIEDGKILDVDAAGCERVTDGGQPPRLIFNRDGNLALQLEIHRGSLALANQGHHHTLREQLACGI